MKLNQFYLVFILLAVGQLFYTPSTYAWPPLTKTASIQIQRNDWTVTIVPNGSGFVGYSTASPLGAAPYPPNTFNFQEVYGLLSKIPDTNDAWDPEKIVELSAGYEGSYTGIRRRVKVSANLDALIEKALRNCGPYEWEPFERYLQKYPPFPLKTPLERRPRQVQPAPKSMFAKELTEEAKKVENIHYLVFHINDCRAVLYPDGSAEIHYRSEFPGVPIGTPDSSPKGSVDFHLAFEGIIPHVKLERTYEEGKIGVWIVGVNSSFGYIGEVPMENARSAFSAILKTAIPQSKERLEELSKDMAASPTGQD